MNIFTRKLLAVLSLSIVSMAGLAQAIGDYRSAANGTWTTLATWQRCSSITPITWVTPTVGQGYPGQNVVATAPVVTIQAAHDVDLNVSPARNIGSLVLVGGTALSFNGGTLTTSGNFSLTINNNLTIGSFWADATFGGTGTLTVTGTVDVAAGAFFTREGSGNTIFGAIDLAGLGFITQSSTGNLTVNGTSQIDGFFTDDETTGITTFTGLVTNTGSGLGGGFTSTTVTQENRMIFNGGITNSGTFTAGGIQLATNQTITANAGMTIQSGLDCDGHLTIAGNSTVSVTGDESNIAPLGSTGAAAGNLTINSGASLTLTGTAGAGVLDVTGNAIINGTLTLNSASQGAADFRGTLTVGGTFTDLTDIGVNTFYGAVSNTGTWATTAVTTVTNMIFQNGLANNGTFNAGSATFNTRNQALTGGSTIAFTSLVVVTGFTVTNSNTSAVTMSSSGAAVLSGTGGTWTQGANSTLNYAGSTLTVAAFNASNTGNTVNYSRPGNATVRDATASTYYHLTISGTNTKSSTANLNIDGNITISGSSQLDVGTGADDITVAGNWTVTSSVDPLIEGARTVTFDGTTDQTISFTPAGIQTFNNLIINKATGNVLLMASPATSVTVAGILTLTNGGLQLNGNTLSITNTAVTAIGRTNGFIISETTGTPYSPVVWTMGTVIGSYTFPFGTAAGAANYIPFVFNKTTTGTGAAGRISVATYPTGAANTPFPSGVIHVQDAAGANNSANTVDRFWIITPSVYTVSPTATLTFTARTAEIGTITLLRGQRWNGTNWDLPLAGASGTATTATVPNVSAFSPWAISGNNSPLPVELKYFKAAIDGDVVKLDWETAQELNNDFFTVEKTSDLESFEEVVKRAGQGTSTELHHYSEVDANPYFGRSYYRLKQTDFDGKFTYSNVQMIDYSGPEVAFLRAYPSPSKDRQITIEIKGLKETKSVPILIVNSRGQKVMEKTLQVKTPGSVKEELVFDSFLSSGLYIIKAGSTLQLTQKIVVE